MAWAETPELVPVLSRGKHRNPRKGACFMEFASYLAGERWSDHPSCTHPLLSLLARAVNDNVSDAGREKLVPLIPSVVGLTGDDPRVDVGIALRSAATALPVVAQDRQRALATGILAAERFLDGMDAAEQGNVATTDALDHAQRSLSQAPLAAKWARQFIVDTDLSPKAFQRRSAPNIVRTSVLGIAVACISDRDEMLCGLLATVIDDCSLWLAAESSQTRTEPARAPVPSPIAPTSV